MSKVAPDAKKHRKEFMAYVVDKATAWHREHLGDLYARWQEWNDSYFQGKLVPPYILLAEPSSPQALADYSNRSCFGGQGQVRVRPSLITGEHPMLQAGSQYAAGRRLFVQDVTLHETTHLYCDEVLEKPEASYKGHGPVFAGECNRIGALLGLGPVRPAKARGPLKDLPSCARWLYVVRPEGYYLGALAPEGQRGQKRWGRDPEAEKREGKNLFEQLVKGWEQLTPEQQQAFLNRIGATLVSASGDGKVGTDGIAGKISKWYRQASRRFHPDRGGDEKFMALFNDACDQLRKTLGL